MALLEALKNKLKEISHTAGDFPSQLKASIGVLLRQKPRVAFEVSAGQGACYERFPCLLHHICHPVHRLILQIVYNPPELALAPAGVQLFQS